MTEWLSRLWRRSPENRGQATVTPEAPCEEESHAPSTIGVGSNGAPRSSVAREAEMLRAFLQAESEATADEALDELFRDGIEPILGRVIRTRLPRHPGANLRDDDSLQEAVSEARANLLVRLRRLRETPGDSSVAILDIAAYAATAARHACDAILRRRDPGRLILENRLRYLLRHTQGLALWEENGQTVCGFQVWRDNPHNRAGAGPLPTAPELLKDNFLHLPVGPAGDAEFCAGLLDGIGRPVVFQDMVSTFAAYRPPILAQSTGMLPIRGPEGGKLPEVLWEEVVDTTADIPRRVIHRDQLRRLWGEVRQLPPRQCTALLMNLRDGEGHGVVALLPILGIATRDEIAAVMQMTPAQLDDFWDRLPLDDNEIACLIEATRQQVINLRKVARERLVRRLA